MPEHPPTFFREKNMRCIVCNLEKSEGYFNWRNKKLSILHNRCKECQSFYDARLYKNSSTRAKKIRERAYCQNEENRKYVREYLLSHHCIDCGETDIRCLDFDHVRGEKITNVSFMVHQGRSIERIRQEISKCEVRCSNCHRKRTMERLEYPDVA